VNYISLQIKAPAILEEELTMLLFDYGAEGVAIDDPAIIQHHLNNKDWDASIFDGKLIDVGQITLTCLIPADEQGLAASDAVAAAVADLDDVIFTSEVQPEIDWQKEWKQGFEAQEIGENLLITPVWLQDHPADGRKVIVINPGMAFGTGDHATTAMVLSLLEKYLQPGAKVFDVGCGSGILAIAALRLGAAEVKALDIDPICAQVVAEHLRINDLPEDALELRIGDILSDNKLLNYYQNYQSNIVVANICADVIINLAPLAASMLAKGGLFICSGIIDERSQLVADVLVEAGLEIIDIANRDGWYAYVANVGGK